ncbi:hypothetical protein TMatcc_005023 [Talaromyces marneffei ATCC 18224]
MLVLPQAVTISHYAVKPPNIMYMGTVLMIQLLCTKRWPSRNKVSSYIHQESKKRKLHRRPNPTLIPSLIIIPENERPPNPLSQQRHVDKETESMCKHSKADETTQKIFVDEGKASNEPSHIKSHSISNQEKPNGNAGSTGN